MQKESNQTEQRNSNCERNKIRLLIWTKVKFYSIKILLKLVKQKEGFKTKIQALESPDSDKRAKSYTKKKIGSGITIRKITDLIREKKNDERSLERTNKCSLFK